MGSRAQAPQLLMRVLWLADVQSRLPCRQAVTVHSYPALRAASSFERTCEMTSQLAPALSMRFSWSTSWLSTPLWPAAAAAATAREGQVKREVLAEAETACWALAVVVEPHGVHRLDAYRPKQQTCHAPDSLRASLRLKVAWSLSPVQVCSGQNKRWTDGSSGWMNGASAS